MSTRPEPVLDAAKIASAVSGVVLAIGAIFVLIGWATADEVQNWAVIAGGIVTAVGTLVAVVLPLITAYGARAQVTPLVAPLSVDGVPLITDAPGRPAQPVESLRDAPGWPPLTPAVAAEPTPIGAEAEAAAAGRRD